MRVYEAVIYNHSDFGKEVFRRFYDSEAKAYGNGEESLNAFIDTDLEYARSYELRVYEHKVH